MVKNVKIDHETLKTDTVCVTVIFRPHGRTISRTVSIHGLGLLVTPKTSHLRLK